jgi:UDP-N-acetylmuramate--alanine ligase
MFFENKKIHFIGIGGIGMSGLAKILLGFNVSVSGSDLSENSYTEDLKSLGATVYNGHHANNLIGVDIVVYSTAIKGSNPEMEQTIKAGLYKMRRAELLAELMKHKQSIAVAGSHGKTTSSALLSSLLSAAGEKPAYIVGGLVNDLKTHAEFNAGDYLVAEADESDGSFEILNQNHSIITNIDNDHLDYHRTFENLKDSFIRFANNTRDGFNIINREDPILRELSYTINGRVYTIGLDKNADYWASDISYKRGYIFFTINFDSESLHAFKVYGFGEHNLLNTLGAIAMAHKLGLDMKVIRDSLLSFKGAKRRLDKLLETDKTIVYDDYAHHVTEIKSTLDAIKNSFSDYRVECIFQPHRYSRMKESWSEIKRCFDSADGVYVLDVFAAGESPIDGVSAFSISDSIGENSQYLTRDQIPSIIKDDSVKRVIVCLGAGSISSWIREDVSRIS